MDRMMLAVRSASLRDQTCFAVLRHQAGIAPTVSSKQAWPALLCAVFTNYTILRIDDTVTSSRSLHKFGVLFGENLEVPLGLPVTDTVCGENQIHLLQSALIRFRIQSPDDEDRDDVHAAEYVKGVSFEFIEDRWQ